MSSPEQSQGTLSKPTLVILGILLVAFLVACIVLHDGTIQNTKIVPTRSLAPVSLAPNNILQFVQFAAMAASPAAQVAGLPTGHGLIPVPTRPVQINGSGSSKAIFSNPQAEILVDHDAEGRTIYRLKTWTELQVIEKPTQ